jgi:hypothetical protein
MNLQSLRRSLRGDLVGELRRVKLPRSLPRCQKALPVAYNKKSPSEILGLAGYVSILVWAITVYLSQALTRRVNAGVPVVTGLDDPSSILDNTPDISAPPSPVLGPTMITDLAVRVVTCLIPLHISHIKYRHLL